MTKEKTDYTVTEKFKKRINKALDMEIKITKGLIIWVFIVCLVGSVVKLQYDWVENSYIPDKKGVYVLEYENNIYLVNPKGGIVLHGEKK